MLCVLTRNQATSAVVSQDLLTTHRMHKVSLGLVCKELVNECSSPRLNDCDQNAICVDTVEAYTCICRPGFTDMDEFRNPGRRCHKEKTNDRCSVGKNDCDRNARCTQIGDDDYTCACPVGFNDKSPSLSRPGRVSSRFPRHLTKHRFKARKTLQALAKRVCPEDRRLRSGRRNLRRHAGLIHVSLRHQLPRRFFR
ncbi:EGF-like domain protein [Cooperia oncophora]